MFGRHSNCDETGTRIVFAGDLPVSGRPCIQAKDIHRMMRLSAYQIFTKIRLD